MVASLNLAVVEVTQDLLGRILDVRARPLK
jgi:hypothetical protein